MYKKLSLKKNSIIQWSATLVFMLACPYSNASFAESIAIITNIENSNKEISQSEAINMFMGRYRQLADGKTVKTIDNLSVKDTFYKSLLNKSPAEINAYWARLVFSGHTQPPENVSNSQETIDAIIKDANAISYIPSSELNKKNYKIKVLFLLESK